MKKVIATLMATAMLGATCVGFAACGGDETDHFETAENFTSEQVDKETFVTATDRKNFENVLVEATIKCEKGEGDAYVQGGVRITIVVDGSNMRVVCHAFGDEEATTFYNFLEGEYCGSLGNTAFFRKDETSVWQTASEDMSYYPYEFMDDFLKEMVDHLAYMQYSFIAEKKGYYLEMDGVSETLKFKDGKLYSSNVIVESQDRGIEYYNVVYTYGGQSVTLPEMAE